jgi:hypothetical protein
MHTCYGERKGNLILNVIDVLPVEEEKINLKLVVAKMRRGPGSSKELW